MKQTWSLPDIFDLEYCFHLDRGTSEAQLHKRDRSVFLAMDSSPEKFQPDSSSLLHSWLNARRTSLKEDTDQTLPGPGITEAVRLVLIIFPLIGLGIGVISGLAFFSYSGTTPVNVFHFLFIFIFSQLLLILLLLCRLSLRFLGIARQWFPLLFKLYTACIAKITERLSKRLRTSFTADTRDRYRQILGLIRSTHYKYGLVLYWPLFAMAQRALIGFNLGLLGASFFRIATSDLAFGWQSTIQLSSETLYSLVKVLALPWSWVIPPEIAYPSLTAIEGSRIVLKDGIYHLATQDLISWWPFLLMNLFVYGLLFRVVMAIIAKYYTNHRLSSITFDTTDAHSVLRRMQSPLVSTQASSESKKGTTVASYQPQDTSRSGDEITPTTSFPVLVMIAQDIAEKNNVEVFLSFIRKHGFTITETMSVLADYGSDQNLLDHLNSNKSDTNSGVFLILESWMPPIGEVIGFIDHLRAAVGGTAPLYIGLVGKPIPGNPPSRPASGELAIWQQKIDSLADPNVKIIPYEYDGST